MRKYVEFILGAAVLAGVILGASALDVLCPVPLFSLAAKLLMTAAFLLYAAKKKLALAPPCKPRYWLAALIPFIFALPMSFGRLDASPHIWAALFGFGGVLTTAALEELYFRAAALHIFRGEKVTYKLTAALALVFSASHAVNFFFADALSVTLQLAVAFALGMFTLGLMLRTRNIFIPILAHLMLNGTAMFFQLFSQNSGAVGSGGYIIICLLMTVTLTFAGVKLTKGVLNETI